MYAEYQATTDGTFELLRRSGSLGGALTHDQFETTFPTIVPTFFTFLPEAATHLVHLTLKAFGAFCEHPDGVPYHLRFPLLPALRRLELEVDLDPDEDLPKRGHLARNAINVYTYLLSTPSSFPVLTTFDLCVSNGPVALQAFVYSAHMTDAWRRFGMALVALPATFIINFELADIPEKTGAFGRETDQTTEQLMDHFFEQHVPALWQYYCRFRDWQAAGYVCNSGAPRASGGQG
ncbi:hypothetical protein C8T65DRAFT_87252 [Cerioporus squamosus]|nr:hypothetical protein C8T65DRAFT_87252 [Cerioporus squamosus]